MKIKQNAIAFAEKSKTGKRLINDRRYRLIVFAVGGFIFNLLFAFYNGAVGIVSNAVWLKASAIYYIILAVMQFSAIFESRRHNKQNEKNEYSLMKFAGIMFCILGFVLTAVIYINLKHKTATKYSTITMITIATYTFIKIALAIRKAVKTKNKNTPLLSVIQNISYAQVAVALLTMQQSMLISFAESEAQDDTLLNALTGAGVCVFIVMLGIFMIIKSCRR